MKIGDVLTFENKQYDIKYIYKNYLMLGSIEKNEEGQPNEIIFTEIKDQNKIVKVKDMETVQQIIYKLLRTAVDFNS